VQDPARCKELLPELASIAALAQERLDSLLQIVQRAPAATENGVLPTPDVAKSLQTLPGLPGWARAAFHSTAPESSEEQLRNLRTLSVIVSGFVALGLDVTVTASRGKEAESAAAAGIMNICWENRGQSAEPCGHLRDGAARAADQWRPAR